VYKHINSIQLSLGSFINTGLSTFTSRLKRLKYHTSYWKLCISTSSNMVMLDILGNLMKTWIGRNRSLLLGWVVLYRCYWYWSEFNQIYAYIIHIAFVLIFYFSILGLICIDELLAVVFNTKPGFVSMTVSCPVYVMRLKTTITMVIINNSKTRYYCYIGCITGIYSSLEITYVTAHSTKSLNTRMALLWVTTRICHPRPQNVFLYNNT